MQAVARVYDLPYAGVGSRVQEWLLMAYVVLLPVQVGFNDKLHLAPSDILLVMMLGGFALGFGRLRIVKSGWSIWHLGLLVSFAVATIVGFIRVGVLMQYVLINKDAGILVLFASYVVFLSYADSWIRIRRLLRTLILSVSVQNAFFLLLFGAERFVGFAIPGLNVADPRLHGLLIDPNAYGGLLVLVLAIHMITYCGRQPIISGLMGKFTTLNLAMGILLTYSRSAWIGLAVILLLVVFLRPKAGAYLVIVCALAVGIILQLFQPEYIDEMRGLAFRPTTASRLDIIGSAIPMFWESPSFGIGLGTFVHRFDVIIHNTPVWILAEFGLFGFVWFTGFLVWFLQVGLRAYRMSDLRNRPLVFALIAADLAMIGLSMGIEALYQRHWWMILALIAASYRVSRGRGPGIRGQGPVTSG